MEESEGLTVPERSWKYLERNGHSERKQRDFKSAGAEKKPQFSGSCSFLVTLLGCSMGTSDFWRFPYLVFRNGGGAFLIPFCLTMAVCGIPLYFLEVATSQFSGKGPLSLWDMSPFFKGIGYTLLLVHFVNNTYYNVLRAWIFEYLAYCFQSAVPWATCDNSWNTFSCIELGRTIENTSAVLVNTSAFVNGSLQEITPNASELLLGNGSVFTGNETSVASNMTSAEEFWQYEVLKLSSGLEDLGPVQWRYVLYVFIWRVLVFLCMVKSIKSIEKVMYVTVFIPIILMIAVWVRSLTLDGATTGMFYYIIPKFDRLASPRVWVEGALMGIYTLGPGWGNLPVIGSHNKFRSNCLRHCVFATICDCLSAVFNGLICFSVLGVMAHDAGLPLEKTVTSGLSLGFVVYPSAFTYFPLTQLWTGVYLISLVLVGIDFQVMSVEIVINCLQDIWPNLFEGRKRLVACAVFNLLAVAASIPFCTQGGIYCFILMDWYALAWCILFIGLVECIVFLWIYGGDRISNDLEIMLGRPLPSLLRINAAFLTPAVLTFLVALSFAEYKPPQYGSYFYPSYAQIIGWMLAITVVSPIFITFVYRFFKTNGSLQQKINAITKPSKTWLPNDNSSLAKYQINMPRRRTFWEIFLYNISGKYTLSRTSEKGGGAIVNGDSVLVYHGADAKDEYLPMYKHHEMS